MHYIQYYQADLLPLAISRLSAMDRNDIDDLLNSLNVQSPTTDDSDILSEVFSQSLTQAATGDNDEQNSLIINGREYVKSKNLAHQIRKGSDGKSSSMWKLGVELKRVDDGVKFQQCMVCMKMNKSVIYAVAATTGAFQHLKNDHGIVNKNKDFVQLEKQKHLDSGTPKDSPIVCDFNH